MTQSSNVPSQWQQRIEGEWHGLPSIFDARGNHVGYNKVYRSSVFEHGQTVYYMDTRLQDMNGPLHPRLEATKFAFGVIDSDQDRVYLGPDFFGEGQPYGGLVDSNYYSPAWQAHLRTLVHILPDGKTQVYSSQLYEGPALLSVFNGIYRNVSDYHSNPATKASIEAFCETEKVNGRQPHALPEKHAGVWTGDLEVYGEDQKKAGVTHVSMRYRPLALLRAEVTVEMTGAIQRTFTYTRFRNGNLHTFDGPDMYGNGLSYGRALYTVQHFYGEAAKIRGREFIIDDNYTMSAVWQYLRSDRLRNYLFGVLTWTPGEQVLTPRQR